MSLLAAASSAEQRAKRQHETQQLWHQQGWGCARVYLSCALVQKRTLWHGWRGC